MKNFKKFKLNRVHIVLTICLIIIISLFAFSIKNKNQTKVYQNDYSKKDYEISYSISGGYVPRKVQISIGSDGKYFIINGGNNKTGILSKQQKTRLENLLKEADIPNLQIKDPPKGMIDWCCDLIYTTLTLKYDKYLEKRITYSSSDYKEFSRSDEYIRLKGLSNFLIDIIEKETGDIR